MTVSDEILKWTATEICWMILKSFVQIKNDNQTNEMKQKSLQFTYTCHYYKVYACISVAQLTVAKAIRLGVRNK